MCCVVEMEDVLLSEYDARLLDPTANLPDGDLSNSAAIFTAISFKSIDLYLDFFISLRMRGVYVIIYIFDSWDVADFFYNRNRKIKSRLVRKFRISEFCDVLAVPFIQSIEEFYLEDRKHIRHIPLGVDASLVDGMRSNRPLTVFAYGRQPEHIIDFFSREFNKSGTPYFMYHTDHMHIGEIRNFYSHRRSFWKIAEMSSVAFAYDPKETHGHRFPYSIVGQRWFESLAAGCAVLGSRPDTPESETLLDWKEATIELPESKNEALGFTIDLVNDARRLEGIRTKNVSNIRGKHDWRVRFKEFFKGIL